MAKTPEDSINYRGERYKKYDDVIQNYNKLVQAYDEIYYDGVYDNSIIESDEDDEDSFRGVNSRRTGPSWQAELLNLISMALPVTGTAALDLIPMLVTVALVGHVSSSTKNADEKVLWADAMTLAETLFKCIAIFTGFGINSALDTLCSQAHGAKANDLLSVYLQTGMIVMSLLSILMGVILFNCENIMLALGQHAEVSRLAGVWSLYILPGIPFLFFYDTLRKVLQAQNKVNRQFCAIILANITHVVIGYYLVHHTTWGWLGAAAARSIFHLISFILLAVYTFCDKENELWNGFQIKEAIRTVPQFLRLGIPGMLQFCFEWWAAYFLIVLSGTFRHGVSVVAIGASNILINLYSITWVFYYGISISCHVRVGNALGAGDPQSARMTSIVALFTVELFAAFNSILFSAFKDLIPTIFTNDERIHIVTTRLIFILVLAQIPTAANITAQGILRGQGRQGLGAQIQFLGFFMIGIPLGSHFAFPLRFGPLGLWCGFLVCLPIMALIGVSVIKRSDWRTLSVQAQERLGRTSIVL